MQIVAKQAGYILAGLSILGFANNAFSKQEVSKGLEPTPISKPIDFDLSKFSFDANNLEIKRQLPELSLKELTYYQKIIKNDFSEIQYFPKEVLLNTSIQYSIRLEINKLLSKGLNYNQELSELIYSDLYKVIPDILELIKIIDKSEIDYTNSDWVYYNPRVIEYLWQKGIQPSKEENIAFLNMQKALEILGIFELRRFDNVSEIIRNRYLISDSDTQARLKEILKKDYFNTIHADQRPLCVVLYPAQHADYNGAFQETGDLYTQIMTDDIDYLTSKHKVVYFECQDSDSVVKAIEIASSVSNQKIDYLILAGHGNTDGIELSRKGLNAELNIDDYEELQKLSSYLNKDSKVILKSCSTAKNNGDGQSFAHVLHKAWPHTEVIAPNNDTPAMLLFDESGHLVGINYSLASAVNFKPNGIVEKETLSDNISKIITENSLNLLNKNVRDLKSLSLIDIGQLAIGFFLVKWAFDGLKFLGKKIQNLFRKKETRISNLKIYLPEEDIPDKLSA
jgi:hypothetical protein